MYIIQYIDVIFYIKYSILNTSIFNLSCIGYLHILLIAT